MITKNDQRILALLEKEKHPMTVPKFIRHLLATTWNDESPANINKGNCDSFAHDICMRFEDGEIYWGDEIPNFEWEDYYDPSGHCFFYFETEMGNGDTGLYYDSECPDGVKDPRQLPFFKRQAEYSELYT